MRLPAVRATHRIPNNDGRARFHVPALRTGNNAHNSQTTGSQSQSGLCAAIASRARTGSCWKHHCVQLCPLLPDTDCWIWGWHLANGQEAIRPRRGMHLPQHPDWPHLDWNDVGYVNESHETQTLQSSPAAAAGLSSLHRRDRNSSGQTSGRMANDFRR